MPTVLVNVRIDSKTLEILKTIASGRGEKYLSAIIREALTEYVSAYTGDPTLRGLQRRINEIEARLKKVEDELTKHGKVERSTQ